MKKKRRAKKLLAARKKAHTGVPHDRRRRGPKPGTGGRPRAYSVRVMVTLPRDVAEAIEGWRKRQPGKPQRSVAILALIQAALQAS